MIKLNKITDFNNWNVYQKYGTTVFYITKYMETDIVFYNKETAIKVCKLFNENNI